VVQEIKETEVGSVEHQIKKIKVLCGRRRPTNRPCSLELISHGTLFFSHNKIASVGLSAAETISQTA
jgi:hypothetical protein